MASNAGTQVDRHRSYPLVYLYACLLVYLLIGLQYAALTPAWQVPDEPAHYNYIRSIAGNRALPVLESGDYNQTLLSQLTSENFPPEVSIEPLRYESWQPPLYYLLAAPIFLLFGGALLPLRLFSLALGAGVIIFAYLAARELTDDPWLPVIAAGFIAFIPQHVAMMAGVNNDSLSEFLIALGLWRILRANRLGFGSWDLGFWVWGLGFVIGLAFVTKANAYVLAPVAGVSLLLVWRRSGPRMQPEGARALVRSALIIFVPALLIGSLWWGRNLYVYGWPDFMASIRHEAVVVGQPRTAEWISQFGAMEVARRFAQTTFQSFWGQFGWMGVVMDRRVYLLLMAFSAALTVGILLAVVRRPSSVIIRRDGTTLLLVSALLTLALYLYYNISFVQHQGRYLFPALIPMGLAAAVSLWEWGRVIESVSRQKIGWVIAGAALIGMAALDVFALYRFIIPALS